MLGRRSVRDLKLTPLVFDMLGLKMRPKEIRDFMDRLEVIHRRTVPAPVTDEGGGQS